MPEIADSEARQAVLRNTSFALGPEIGGREWEGIKRDGVGHDRESTLMGAAMKAVSKLDTEVLPSVQAIETQGEEARAALHSLDEAEKAGDEAAAKLAAHTNAMELEKRRKHAERIELEKDIVTWHLAQSEESEGQTRRWLQGALINAEKVMEQQAQEIKRLQERYTEDTGNLKGEVAALKEQMLSTNRTNKTMQEDMALRWRNLREELSDSKFEREKLEARLHKTESELRLATEDYEATKSRLDSALEQIKALEKANGEAVHQALMARRELEERLEYANDMRLAHTHDLVNDRLMADRALAMELQHTQLTSHSLHQEKIEANARLGLAETETAKLMRELVESQNANKDLRDAMEGVREKLGMEQVDNGNLRIELSAAADDVINLQHELNTVLKVQATLRKENRDLGLLDTKAVDYREYMPPYKLNQFEPEEWESKNEALIKKYQDIKSELM